MLNFFARLFGKKAPSLYPTPEEQEEFQRVFSDPHLRHAPEPTLKPGWDRMPRSQSAGQPPPPEPIPVTDWVPPPRIIPVITHRLNGDDTVCGLHTLETTDKGKFTKQLDQPGLTLFHCNIVGDEERVSHCATCFAEYSNPNEVPTGYLAKSYITYGDVMGSPPALAAPTTDEKGRVPPETDGRGTWHEAVGNLCQMSSPETADGFEKMAKQWLMTEEGVAPSEGYVNAPPSMTPEQFCFWLQGYFEIQKPTVFTEEQVKVLHEHLTLVFTHIGTAYHEETPIGIPPWAPTPSQRKYC